MTEPSRDKFSPAQCRGARGLLDWSQERLAIECGLSVEAVQLFEACQGDLSHAELKGLGAAFNDAGCIAKAATLQAGEGVRLTTPDGLIDPWYARVALRRQRSQLRRFP